MQKLIYSLLLLGFMGCKENRQQSFEVEGTIKNVDAKTVYLEETAMGDMRPVIVDSFNLKDGRFELKALAKEESVYNLRLDGQMYPLVSFINDAEKITIDADPMSKEVYSIKGSPASQALKEYLFTTSDQLRSIYNLNKTLDSLQQSGAADSLLQVRRAERDRQVKELKNYTTNFISNSKSPSLAVFALGSYQSLTANPAFGIEGFSQEEVQGIVQKTASRFPAHTAVAAINKSLQQAAQEPPSAAGGTSWVSKPAPDFTLPDVNGKPVSLSSFKGKYVLVDFWASWCPPCRAENPNLVKAYQKFKDKNFTVLGVSLDRPGQKDKWLEAIQKDNLTWTHVSDLKFWDSEVVNLYGFQGIPYNVLVDPNGVVIAESLRGADLEQKLAEVLK